jgi:hypothetical protein
VKDLTQRAHRVWGEEVDGAGDRDNYAEGESKDGFPGEHRQEISEGRLNES